ncbi:MAG: hypothetical protein P3X23_003310 [Thermosynechococcus sp. Uc]|uniref:hypothetical protein n=1 Tax=Thermosynechococcus sp. Uc TaxID=3034853 RepID=UPI00259DEAE5|nr:hypothetical protein [Thermosynechococcus sp. Uc]MDM7326135.1 hypothetical protein [Thermosynechococcus sp. Uc]
MSPTPRMVWIVIGCNCLIALISLWLAWQLVKLRQILRGVSRALLDAERSTHRVLGGAPEVIIIGQRGVAGLRSQLPKWRRQQRRVRLFLTLVSWIGRYGVRLRRRKR